MEKLELEKNETIHTTFQQMVRYFKEIFAELTSGGTGTLLLVPKGGGGSKQSVASSTTAEERTSSGASSGGVPGPLTLDEIAGVGIRCSFAGGGEMKDMEQLSGGQKTLVALALIL